MTTAGNVRRLVRLLSKNPRVMFASFLYKSKKIQDVSHVTIIIGASTENLYEKDVKVLEEMIPNLTGDEKKAATELLESRKISLRDGIGNNPDYTQADTWWTPKALRGTGIRIHRETGAFQITALVHHKVTIDPGNPLPDTRRPFTKVKDSIRHQLPSSRFRSYSLDHVAGVSANGDTIEFDNVI